MPFSPPDVSGLYAWWVADTIALSDGATVTSWADSGGGGFTLTGVGAPIYKTAGLNSLPTVRFPGTATNYVYNNSVNLAQACSAFFVARRTAATAATGSMVSGAPGANVAMFIDSAQNFGVFAGLTGGLSISAASATNGHVFQVVLNGTSSTGGVDGAGGTYSMGTAGFTTGVSVGTRANRTGEWFDGDIAEICLYSGTVGSTDATSLRNYLGVKYGVAGFSADMAAPMPRRLNYGALLQV